MKRGSDARVVVKLRKPRFQFLSKRDPVEVTESYTVLILDPGFRLSGSFIFQPAIRIVNLRPEIIVDLLDFLSYGVDDLGIVCRRTGRGRRWGRRHALRARALPKRKRQGRGHKQKGEKGSELSHVSYLRRQEFEGKF